MQKLFHVTIMKFFDHIDTIWVTKNIFQGILTLTQ